MHDVQKPRAILIYMGVFNFYIHTRLPTTTWICPNISLEFGFPYMIGLANIPYCYSTGDLVNSWTINLNTWSNRIAIGLGYLAKHLDSTKFDISIIRLSLLWISSNHPVSSSSIVTALIFKKKLSLSFLWRRYILYIHRVFLWYFFQPN